MQGHDWKKKECKSMIGNIKKGYTKKIVLPLLIVIDYIQY